MKAKMAGPANESIFIVIISFAYRIIMIRIYSSKFRF